MIGAMVSCNTLWMRMKDKHWVLLAPLLALRGETTKRSRPRQDNQLQLEGILWIFRTGTQWNLLRRNTYPRR